MGFNSWRSTGSGYGSWGSAGSRFFVKKIPLLVAKTNQKGGTEHRGLSPGATGPEAGAVPQVDNQVQHVCHLLTPAAMAPQALSSTFDNLFKYQRKKDKL
jgi:hypothetical protein